MIHPSTHHTQHAASCCRLQCVRIRRHVPSTCHMAGLGSKHLVWQIGSTGLSTDADAGRVATRLVHPPFLALVCTPVTAPNRGQGQGCCPQRSAAIIPCTTGRAANQPQHHRQQGRQLAGVPATAAAENPHITDRQQALSTVSQAPR